MNLDQLCEVAEHGADCGWPGFTYTHDAAAFYEANSDDVWQLLCDYADEQGTVPLRLVAGFTASPLATDAATFGNLLAWFALEEIGHWVAGR